MPNKIRSSCPSNRNQLANPTSFADHLNLPRLKVRCVVILVTGASGNVGGAVLNALLKLNAPVRAMYRSASDAAQAPAAAERAIADYSDRASLDRALDGVDRVFLVCSPIPQLVEFESAMVEACRAHRVRYLVQLSALGAGQTKASFPTWHYEVEQKVRASGVPATVLRSESFMQNVVAFYSPTIRAQSAFFAALKNAPIAYIDLRDIAAVAATVLTNQEQWHAGQTYTLTGPELLTHRDIAERLSILACRPIRYVDVPAAELKQAMLGQGMPSWLADALLELQAFYTDGPGAAVTDDVRRILNNEPRRFDQFLAENAGSFRREAASA
ncbi:MAG: NmrA family NAD(P)-binding protein [Terriglobales bacterium]